MGWLKNGDSWVTSDNTLGLLLGDHLVTMEFLKTFKCY